MSKVLLRAWKVKFPSRPRFQPRQFALLSNIPAEIPVITFYFQLTNFALSIYYRSVRNMPPAAIPAQPSSYFIWLNFALWFGSVFLCSRISTDAFVKRFRVLEVMEPLHVDGQSIKFVDRKMWKRDSFDVKLSFEGKIDFTGKVFAIASAPNTEGEASRSHSARRKCPIEIEYPRKRRILKRPKRFKTYFSDRKPLSIPSFSFPRYSTRT